MIALLTSQQPAEALALATTWARAGDGVTVVLLDAAAIVLRPDHGDASVLHHAADAGVRVWAHAEAVTERAPGAGGEVAELVDLDAVAALLGDPGTQAQWW